MARNLTAAMQAALQAPNVRPVWLCKVVFESGTVYVWSGIGELSWSGNTYVGVGRLGGVSPINESTEVRADGVVLTLSGIDPSILALVLGDVRQSKEATLHLALLDDSGAVIADPYEVFGGLVDVPRINEDPRQPSISLQCESRMIGLRRPRIRRYTDEDQQQEHSGDLGMEYVTAATTRTLWAGGKPDKYVIDEGWRGL